METKVNGGKLSAKVIKVCAILFLLIMIVFTLYPIIYTIFGSLKTNAELTAGGSFLPKEWQFQNYYQAFVQADFVKYTINSVIVAVVTTALAVVTCALAGFMLARRDFVGKKILLALYTAMMFISLGSVTLYPIYQLLQRFGLHKSIAGLVIALTGGQAVNVLLVMGFVKGVPRELDEAAIIDGCSIYGVFGRIIVPVIKPILAVVALFVFRNTWNDYVTTLIMTISNKKLQTLTVAVVQLKYSVNAAAEWHIMLAGASIAIIPILIVYLLCNKQFIAGLTAGAVKG